MWKKNISSFIAISKSSSVLTSCYLCNACNSCISIYIFLIFLFIYTEKKLFVSVLFAINISIFFFCLCYFSTFWILGCSLQRWSNFFHSSKSLLIVIEAYAYYKSVLGRKKKKKKKKCYGVSEHVKRYVRRFFLATGRSSNPIILWRSVFSLASEWHFSEEQKWLHLKHLNFCWK